MRPTRFLGRPNSQDIIEDTSIEELNATELHELRVAIALPPAFEQRLVI
jgi:hypothetical protein